MDYATRLTELCSRDPGLTALLSLPEQGGAALFWLLCTDGSTASMPQVLPRLAAQAGALVTCADEGEGLLCLYEGEPRMVLLRPLPARQYVSTPDARLLWEWRGEVRELRHDPPVLSSLLQRAENSIWLLLARAARLAEQDCLLEAAALTVHIRRHCLLPLLEHINGRFSGSECHRAGNYAAQLLLTHPAADRESIKDALEAARQIYFALRYELADENFSRLETIELEATQLLQP